MPGLGSAVTASSPVLLKGKRKPGYNRRYIEVEEGGLLVWLASYPRSGNTLLRAVLKQCFDLPSYSGDDGAAYDPEGELFKTVGQLVYRDSSREAFLESARTSDALHLVKTHDEVPLPTDRAIYVVRDGRAAIASYQRFLRDFDHVDFSLEEIARGTRMAYSWGQHVERWMANPADRLLVLRFEELSGSPPLESISEFLGRPVLRPFEVTFDDLNKLDPAFFGVGRNDPGTDLVERTCGDVFWEHNGPSMARLGYRRDKK